MRVAAVSRVSRDIHDGIEAAVVEMDFILIVSFAAAHIVKNSIFILVDWIFFVPKFCSTTISIPPSFSLYFLTPPHL